MSEENFEGEYRQGESLYLYSFAHPTHKGLVYEIYAHSQDEAERSFRLDWGHLYAPELLRRTTW